MYRIGLELPCQRRTLKVIKQQEINLKSNTSSRTH